MSNAKKTLVLDFDGVLHSYTSGWKGADVIPDPPVEGAMYFLVQAHSAFKVAIFSSRSNEPGGVEAMKDWLCRWLAAHLQATEEMNDATALGSASRFVTERIMWPTVKPPAFVTLDDRALQFTGTFPSIEELLAFRTWQQPVEKSWTAPAVAEREVDNGAVVALLSSTVVAQGVVPSTRPEGECEETFSLEDVLHEGFRSLGWSSSNLVTDEALQRLADSLDPAMRKRALVVLAEVTIILSDDARRACEQVDRMLDPDTDARANFLSETDRQQIRLLRRLRRALGARYVKIGGEDGTGRYVENAGIVEARG